MTATRSSSGFLPACVFALVCLHAPASAQTVTGVVRSSESGDVLGGVLMALVDSSGTRAHGALTDSLGRYAIRSVRPGSYTLIAERLGYGAYDSALLQIAGSSVITLNVALEPQPIAIDAIPVEASSRCEMTNREPKEIAVLWNAARTALRVAAWAAEQHHLRNSGR